MLLGEFGGGIGGREGCGAMSPFVPVDFRGIPSTCVKIILMKKGRSLPPSSRLIVDQMADHGIEVRLLRPTDRARAAPHENEARHARPRLRFYGDGNGDIRNGIGVGEGRRHRMEVPLSPVESWICRMFLDRWEAGAGEPRDR